VALGLGFERSDENMKKSGMCESQSAFQALVRQAVALNSTDKSKPSKKAKC